jgi:thioredoxin reductase (NADPH)
MTEPNAVKQQQKPLTLIGVHRSPKGYALRDFLHRSNIPFIWAELTSDAEAREKAQVSGLSDPRLPICIFPDGERMESATIRQVVEKLGWFKTPSRTEYDLAILGAGPAGLSAAVYGASEGLKTVVIERSVIGGQASTTTRIENYLGFPQGISGNELTARAREQACRFGAEILLLRTGVSAEFKPGFGVGELEDGTKLVMHASICASGIQYRRLGLPEEDRFLGAGVYYGAGASEAQFCIGDEVYVVGGGNSAGQAVMHFSRYARSVVMVLRGGGLKETVSQYLIDRILANPKVKLLTNTLVTALHGDDTLKEITLTNKLTGESKTVPCGWLFLCLGGIPNTDWAEKAGIIRDEAGYLVTGTDLKKFGLNQNNWPIDRDPYFLETNVPGVFAAGDVRHGSVKRCASAVGEGATAVTSVHRYLMEH